MIYSGDRSRGRHVLILCLEGETTVLTPEQSLEIVYHSSDGFNWGDGGSGSAQLAVALLFDVSGDAAFCRRVYQFFKWDFIADLPDAWELERAKIQKWIQDTQNVLAKGEPF